MVVYGYSPRIWEIELSSRVKVILSYTVSPGLACPKQERCVWCVLHPSCYSFLGWSCAPGMGESSLCLHGRSTDSVMC